MNSTKSAFIKTVTIISNVFSPIAAILILKDLRESIAFLMEKPQLSFISMGIFSAIFGYNIYQTNKLDNQSEAKHKSKPKNTGNLNKILSISTLAVIGLFIIIITIARFNGLYYALVGSGEEEKVELVIQDINKYIEDNNIDGIKATKISLLFDSSFGISINGYSLKKSTADKSLKDARNLIPQYLRDDSKVAYIYLFKGIWPK